MNPPTDEQKRLVLDAAERTARDLLGQASKYEALASPRERREGTGQQAIADETYEKHFKPIREAIDAVREEWGMA